MKKVTAWNPNAPQWWITGFNPQEGYEDKDVEKQVMIGSVKFAGREDMYEAFKEAIDIIEDNDSVKSNYIILDDTDHTVWICWYEGGLIS